jgi:hypothetical protein
LSLIVQHGKHGSRHHILRREDFRPDMRRRSFIRSSATPRVSGIKKNAAMNCSTIMRAKNANGAEWNAQR